jgi:hypothetical protein
MDIRAYLLTPDFSHRTKFYSADRFQYDAEHDQIVWPQGQTLHLSSRRKSEQVYVYVADAAVCDTCPVKKEYTDSKSGCHIFRSFFQEDLVASRLTRKWKSNMAIHIPSKDVLIILC